MNTDPSAVLTKSGVILSGRSSAGPRPPGLAALRHSLFHLSDGQLQEAGSHLPELLGIAGGEEAIVAFPAAVVADALAGQDLPHLAGGLLGRVDQGHAAGPAAAAAWA